MLRSLRLRSLAGTPFRGPVTNAAFQQGFMESTPLLGYGVASNLPTSVLSSVGYKGDQVLIEPRSLDIVARTAT